MCLAMVVGGLGGGGASTRGARCERRLTPERRGVGGMRASGAARSDGWKERPFAAAVATRARKPPSRAGQVTGDVSDGSSSVG